MTVAGLGNHFLVELYDCNSNLIADIEYVRKTMLEAAKVSQATIVAQVFHEFNPQGLSGVVVIAESHIAIHSWPEFNCASVDIFSCGSKMLPELAINYLQKAFEAKNISTQKLTRGKLYNQNSENFSVSETLP